MIFKNHHVLHLVTFDAVIKHNNTLKTETKAN